MAKKNEASSIQVDQVVDEKTPSLSDMIEGITVHDSHIMLQVIEKVIPHLVGAELYPVAMLRTRIASAIVSAGHPDPDARIKQAANRA